MNFFQTFRGRLLLVLAILLIATLGVQYYLNLQTEQQNEKLREAQEQALVAGISLGFKSLSSDKRLFDIVKSEEQPFFNESIIDRIKDIIVINDGWEIYDTYSQNYLPDQNKNETNLQLLKDIRDLPPLVDANRLGEDRKYFPNAGTPTDSTDNEAHAIPVFTTNGQWYVMVILKTDKAESARRAAQPLIYMLGVLLVSTLITIFLVWRFTRPIANLSDAARRVANGDLGVRVDGGDRTDEMGKLTARFNEMTAELEKKSELEAKLQQVEKSAVIGRLGSAIAHEIRNPLNYINLTLDHLRAKFAPEDDKKREDFEKLTSQLKSEVARINQQITDFLNYSRPAKANLQPTDVRKVIEDSLRIVEGQAEEQNIKLSLTEAENVPKINGDAEFLRSVFNNLFINAIQAIELDGNLNVKISPDENFVKIEITDTGKGIAEENLPKIFEPYFSTKETGTGLGLAIVHKIVEMHNGTIEVESKLNEGTKFIVKLPKS
jgi:signal transduction histidine kinase